MILGTYIYNTEYYKYQNVIKLIKAFRTLVKVVNKCNE